MFEARFLTSNIIIVLRGGGVAYFHCDGDRHGGGVAFFHCDGDRDEFIDRHRDDLLGVLLFLLGATPHVHHNNCSNANRERQQNTNDDVDEV